VYFRLFLLIVLGYLIIRMIKQFFGGNSGGKENISNTGKTTKRVPKDVGEYVDYEEVDD